MTRTEQLFLGAVSVFVAASTIVLVVGPLLVVAHGAVTRAGAFEAFHWLPISDPTNGYRDALIALASVAAVIWTGGIITMQLKQLRGRLVNGLDCLQTCFIGATLSLFVTGAAMRLVAGLLFSYFAWLTIRRLLFGIKVFRSIKNGENTQLILKHGSADALEYSKDVIVFALWTLGTFSGCIAIVIWPTQLAMCIYGWLLLFLGMQMVLGELYHATDREAKTDRF